MTQQENLLQAAGSSLKHIILSKFSAESLLLEVPQGTLASHKIFRTIGPYMMTGQFKNNNT